MLRQNVFAEDLIMPQLEDTPSDIIKKAREGRGLSLRALADETGISVPELQKMEEWEEKPREPLLNSLGLSLSKLNLMSDNSVSETVAETIGENLRLKMFSVSIGGIISNAYVLAHGHHALLVDSVGASVPAMDFLQQEGFEPLFLMITHGHFDHIAGIEQVKTAYPSIRVIYAGKDVPCDSKYEAYGFSIDAVCAPGHTKDAVCYFVNNAIAFVGDTIFAKSVGKPNYSLESLLKNIREKIFICSDSMILAPGHGPLTTVGDEKKYNPFF